MSFAIGRRGGTFCALSRLILFQWTKGDITMRKQATSAMVTFMVAGSLVLAGMSSAASAPAAPKVPQGWKFTFPDGDVKAGKTVFLNMKCYSCHAIDIPGEKLPPSRSKGAGPELTSYSALPNEYLAESIIKRHTIVAAPGYTVKEGRAAMGEYNHFLTVQELVDLVAFLKQGTKAAGK
jgi:cytochrome c